MEEKVNNTIKESVSEISFLEDKIVCNACNINITLSKDNQHLFCHISGKKHKKKASKFQENEPKYIYICGSDLSKNIISSHFEKIGKISSVNIISTKFHVFRIDFEDYPTIAEIFRNSSDLIGNSKVKISQKLIDFLDDVHDNEIDPLSPLNEIWKIYEIGNQLNFLVDTFCMDSKQEYLIEVLYRKLSQLAYCIEKSAKVVVYGSRLFDFPLKTSDIDITFCFSNRHTLDDIRKHPKFHEIFPKSFVIPGRYPLIRVPVRFLNSTGDISINNVLAIRNNKLLLKYFALAHQFEGQKFNLFNSIVLILKLWRIRYNISGDNNLHINSYGWIILVIFYLQRIKYFPPLQNFNYLKKTLSNFSDSFIDFCYIDGWDCSFYSKIQHFPRPENIPDIKSAIIGFFEFYLNELDFRKYVVNIRIGGSEDYVKREDCIDEVLKHDNITYIEPVYIHFTMPAIIQDPFVLDHNIAKNLETTPFRNILDVIRRTLENTKIAEILRNNSLIDIFFDSNGKGKIYKSKIISCESKNSVLHYSEAKNIVKTLLEVLLFDVKSEIKFTAKNFNFTAIDLIYDDLDKIIFNDNNKLILEGCKLNVKTLDNNWLHKRKKKREKNKENDENAHIIPEKLYLHVDNVEESQELCEYEILLNFSSPDSFEIRFNNLILERDQVFSNLFALIKLKIKQKYKEDSNLTVK